jgi:large subunit ribosomal protein L19
MVDWDLRRLGVSGGDCTENASQGEFMTEKSKVEAAANPAIPEIHPGDTVSVHLRIKEGDRERIQEFRGTVIRFRKGGNDANFTVRRLASHGVGVERTFLLRSPRIEKVEVQRQAKVRRAQLYYLRDLAGKRARLEERRKE